MSEDARTDAAPEEEHDYVGIIMSRSAEGDAVAAVMGRVEGVEVLQQPTFHEIRARGRLRIPFEDVGEELGYEVDSGDIQHEMSTIYGCIVSTDEALLLFSDPTEAFEHLG